jgi:dimethylamine--corrinoid protein Co-methyltransferase
MEKEILTRMGTGQRVKISATQVKEDILAGTKDAADRGSIPELPPAELEQLFDIIADKNRVVGVEPGQEVVLSDDVTNFRMSDDEGAGGGVGLPMSRTLAMLLHERAFAQDSAFLQSVAGVNVPETKVELNTEMQAIETTQLLLTAPLLYVNAPALLWYFRPLGPYGNPTDLLLQGKIQESCDAQEEAAATLTDDLVYVGRNLASVGIDGYNLDTTAALGDAEFQGVLKAVVKLKEVAPEMAVEMGMAGEFVLGMHGQVTFDGQRLAGMFPHQQVKVAEAAGVDIFGPVVNTNCSRSFPWNLARAVTFIKQTSAVSDIPVHVNAGMGVGAVPMHPTPPIDCVTRMSKAMVQIGRVDGL